MPMYANSLPPSSLDAGAVQNVWVTGDGNLTSGTKTQRVALVQRPGGEPIKVAFRCAFSGAPGVIALQLQTSDTDIDTDYVNEGTAISTVNASNVARGEISQRRRKIRTASCHHGHQRGDRDRGHRQLERLRCRNPAVHLPSVPLQQKRGIEVQSDSS